MSLERCSISFIFTDLTNIRLLLVGGDAIRSILGSLLDLLGLGLARSGALVASDVTPHERPANLALDHLSLHLRRSVCPHHVLLQVVLAAAVQTADLTLVLDGLDVHLLEVGFHVSLLAEHLHADGAKEVLPLGVLIHVLFEKVGVGEGDAAGSAVRRLERPLAPNVQTPIVPFLHLVLDLLLLRLVLLEHLFLDHLERRKWCYSAHRLLRDRRERHKHTSIHFVAIPSHSCENMQRSHMVQNVHGRQLVWCVEGH